MDEFTESPSGYLSPTDKLSERQKQCIALVAKGHTSKEIGRILNLSPSTVDNHLNIVLERLGVDSRIAAARLFTQQNEFVKHSLIPISRWNDRHNADEGKSERASTAQEDRGQIMPPLFSIPPLGGRNNNLSQRRRYYHVIQIMLLALMAFSAATVTIAGIVHLFSE
jgi:DNA-binding CsgD family transcriptional regulator